MTNRQHTSKNAVTTKTSSFIFSSTFSHVFMCLSGPDVPLLENWRTQTWLDPLLRGLNGNADWLGVH